MKDSRRGMTQVYVVLAFNAVRFYKCGQMVWVSSVGTRFGQCLLGRGLHKRARTRNGPMRAQTFVSAATLPSN